VPSLCIPARCCGPSRSAHGGYAAGALAHDAGVVRGTALEVTLHQPPPLDTPLQLDEDGDGWALRLGGAVIASAMPHEDDLETLEPVTLEQAVAATASYAGAGGAHPFPDCFACSPQREDGLRIFPGEVGLGLVAAPWTPDETVPADYHEYDGPAQRACLAATWAALDCVGGWASDLLARPAVLGRMTAVVDDLPVVGEPHVVVAQHLGDEGRKAHSAATLWDADGRVVGRARHVWLRVDPERFNR
jgi:hypothetical protein